MGVMVRRLTVSEYSLQQSASRGWKSANKHSSVRGTYSWPQDACRRQCSRSANSNFSHFHRHALQQQLWIISTSLILPQSHY